MTIDSNIVIAYLGGEDRVVGILSTWKQEGIPLFLPTIVESEVLSFAGWTDEEQQSDFLRIPSLQFPLTDPLHVWQQRSDSSARSNSLTRQ
jgi:hypothetical protein